MKKKARGKRKLKEDITPLTESLGKRLLKLSQEDFYFLADQLALLTAIQLQHFRNSTK